GGDAVHVGWRHVRGVAGRRHVGDHVLEAVLADVEVALPAVGVDLGAAGDVVEHELGQRVLGDVRDPPHPHPPGPLAAVLDGDRDDRLPASPTTARAMPDPADIALIYLNGVGEQLAAWEHHPAA